MQHEAEDVRHPAEGRDSHNSSERKQSSKGHDDTFASRKSPDATEDHDRDVFPAMTTNNVSTPLFF